jgi:hypothetical protein
MIQPRRRPSTDAEAGPMSSGPGERSACRWSASGSGAGLVDRLRLLVFPLIAGETGQEPAFALWPDVGLDLVGQSVLDGRIVLSEYRPSGVPPYAS